MGFPRGVAVHYSTGGRSGSSPHWSNTGIQTPCSIYLDGKEHTGQNHSSRISMIGLAPVMIAAKRPEV